MAAVPGAAYGMAVRPPRPKVTTGAGIAVAGAVLMIVGAFLPWFKFDVGFGTQSFNGFSRGSGDTVRDGPVFVFLAVVVGGLAIALLAARRVLPVAIVAVVFAAFSVLAAIADISDVSDLKKLSDLFDGGFKWGAGLWVILVGGMMGLGGSIAALAKRRR
jgi:hypothetical protein